MTDLSSDTRRRILDATVRVIDTSGEAAVRLTQVARSASVTPSVISYHFGNREQLVAEAQAERYVADSLADADRLAHAVSISSSPGEFRAAFADMVHDLVSTQRAASRFKRASALGAGIERPELRGLLGHQQRTITDRMANSVSVAQRRGLVRPDLDATGIAEVIAALSFGVVLCDLDGDDRPHLGVVDILDRFVTSLVAA
jgi:AcrR family transcriptional regulator